MNKDVSSSLADYLERLPLDNAERGKLHASLDSTGSIDEAWQQLHKSLDGATAQPGTDFASLRSIATRVRLAHPKAPQAIDNHGRPRLVTTPPLQRATMIPQPLKLNPVKRLTRWLFSPGRHRGMKPKAGANDAPPPAPRAHWQWYGLFRRLLLMSLIVTQTAYATWFMTAVLPYHGSHPLEVALLILFAILFAWVSAGFWTALMGFWVLLWGRDRFAISATVAPDAPAPEPAARTALVIPICNEDVARVMAGVRATYDSVARTGALELFDFYLLSDSSEADVRVAEVEGWLKLCEDADGFGRIFYRRRLHRIKRKSGNIADFLRRWGSTYRYMVVLDADSVMSGQCLLKLVQMMEANPGTGIIQTAPQASGRETLYARIQQFANRVYGPLFTAGLHFWQLGESHYWGHNAIIRVAPFMQHCALGRLPGRGPLAGEILSHDFVEAALMRRAGWSVWMAYDLPGSYEEMPPTLLDELRRDRRWCQGNLQNFRLFLAQGLHPAHRAVFMTGVMAYLSAPLWFLFLVVTTALMAVHALSTPEYFPTQHQLFPVWPEWHPEWALSLFGVTTTLLLLPKVLAVVILMLRRRTKLYGGPLRVLDSLVLEMVFSSLLAPIRMLFHARFVVTALIGWAVTWRSPPREDTATPWLEAITRHGGGTLLGLAWAAGVYWMKPEFLWWLLPVAGSLVIAIPLSVWSSRAGIGRWFARYRIFLIPEESNPPRELRWTRGAMRRTPDADASFRSAVLEPVSNAVACAAGRPRAHQPAVLPAGRSKLAAIAYEQGPGGLSETERNIVLNDPEILSFLHGRLWREGLPAAWR